MLNVPKAIEEAARKFLEEILKEQNVIIFHDTDQDGIVAGALLEGLLEEKGVHVEAHAVDRDAVRFEEGKTYVLADIRLAEKLARMAEEVGAKLYYVDHHEPDRIPRGAVVLNPHTLGGVWVDPFKWNTALLAWILKGMDEKDEWKAAAAHWADNCIGEHTKEWMEKVYEKYGKETIELVGEMLGLAEHFPDRITEDELREIVRKAKSVEDILEHPLLNELNERMREEFDRLAKEILERPLLRTERLVYHVFRSDVRKIKSPLATNLSMREPEKVWVIGQEGEELVDFSLRCQKAVELGIHLGEIAKEAARLFGGRGGGHPPAAGMKIPKEKEKAFREWIRGRIG